MEANVLQMSREDRRILPCQLYTGIQTKNWYRWTNSCLHYTSWSENLPNFSKSHQISDPKNSQQYMSISIPNSMITSLKKGNNNGPPQKKTRLVVMPLQQKHPPAIREKFWRGAKREGILDQFDITNIPWITMISHHPFFNNLQIPI